MTERVRFYYIKSDKSDKVYVGSTTQPLNNRFYSHKSSDGTASKEILGLGNAQIFLLEEVDLEPGLRSKYEAGWIHTLQDNFAVVNKLDPSGDHWREHKRDQIIAIHKRRVKCSVCSKQMNHISFLKHAKRYHPEQEAKREEIVLLL